MTDLMVHIFGPELDKEFAEKASQLDIPVKLLKSAVGIVANFTINQMLPLDDLLESQVKLVYYANVLKDEKGISGVEVEHNTGSSKDLSELPQEDAILFEHYVPTMSDLWNVSLSTLERMKEDIDIFKNKNANIGFREFVQLNCEFLLESAIRSQITTEAKTN
jgi:hypothetical protein